MYLLFFDGLKDLLGIYDTKPKALALALTTSRLRGDAIVCVYNTPDGGTAICFKCEDGKQTFDGGCCPSAWAASAMATNETLPHDGLTAEGAKANVK